MHELNIIDEGKTALYIAHRTRVMDFEAHSLNFGVDVGTISDLGIHELDLTTGEIVFEWWASEHISLNQSKAEVDDMTGLDGHHWNWL